MSTTVQAEQVAPVTRGGAASPLRKGRRRAVAGLPVLVAAGAMVLGAAEKQSCAGAPRPACYSDVQTLWTARDLGSHALPYLHGGFQGGAFVGHELEYPVLTGLFVWLTSLPARSLTTFMLVTFVALAPFGLATAWLLGRMVGRRALLFALAPTLVWYAFLNWDLLGVASTVGALYAWSRGRWRSAGLLLGVGACFKLWPGLLLLPLAADLLHRRRGRQAAAAVGSAVGVALAVNVPFMVLDYGGWRAPFGFQAVRAADVSANSIWTVLAPSLTSVSVVNLLSEAACAAGIAAVMAAGRRRARRDGMFPFLPACAATVAVFVALGKVHSPQYALWILPFFALLRIGRVWWLLFVVSDLWLFAQFAVFYHPQPALHTSAVVVADAVLLALAVVAMGSQPAVEPLAPDLADLGR